MKQVGLFCVIWLSLSSWGCGGEDSLPPEKVYKIDITGKVVDGLDNSPVAGITVRAVNPTIWLQGATGEVNIENHTVVQVTANSKGEFLFDDLDLKKFFMYIVLVVGDADTGNTTYFNTATGAVDINEMKEAIDTGNTEIIERDTNHTVKVLTVAFVEDLENGPFTGIELDSQGFVFGTAMDADDNLVSGLVVKKIEVEDEKPINPTELSHVIYRNGADTFEGTQTDAAFGSNFIIADYLPIIGTDTQYIGAMLGEQLSDGGAGEAVTVAKIVFSIIVRWIPPK